MKVKPVKRVRKAQEQPSNTLESDSNRETATEQNEAELPRGSWANLTVLPLILDLLEKRDLAACACVCTAWRDEAENDDRWLKFWLKEISPTHANRITQTASSCQEGAGLWKWAKAAGGYRSQFRAGALVRKGDYVSTTFPLSRREGPVTEVLFLDGTEPHILTVHSKKPSPLSTRLQGSTVKVWTATALRSQRPLLVVYDVIKHLQMEDGRLFLWRIADDAIVRKASLDSDTDQNEKAKHWAESPDIVASILNPETLEISDIPLQTSYGRGITPFEYMDMLGGCIAVSDVSFKENRARIRLLDLETGNCFRESSAQLVEAPPDFFQVTNDALMVLSRNSDTANLVVAACSLFDPWVFLWKLKSEWLTPEARLLTAEQTRIMEQAAATAATAASAAQESQQHQDSSINSDTNVDPDPTTRSVGTSVASTELYMAFSTPHHEPITDLSISTSARMIYVIALENMFILQLDGSPLYVVRTSFWRGVMGPFWNNDGPLDVGAFSWPLPNSTRVAFYLDATNSLFVTDFSEQLSTIPRSELVERGEVVRYPRFDNHIAEDLSGARPYMPYVVQAHADLSNVQQRQYSATQSGRLIKASAQDPVIVEYMQTGRTLFTAGESNCSSVLNLLNQEKARGTYVPGIGSIQQAQKCTTALSASHRTTLEDVSIHKMKHYDHYSIMNSSKEHLAPRALICIDPKTGERFRSIPVEGVIEGVHSGGHYLAMAVAPLKGYPAGSMGSLVIIDFSKQGLFGDERDRKNRKKNEHQQEEGNDDNEAGKGKKKRTQRKPGGKKQQKQGEDVAGPSQAAQETKGKGAVNASTRLKK